MLSSLSLYVPVSPIISLRRYKADQAFLVGLDKSPVRAYFDVEVSAAAWPGYAVHGEGQCPRRSSQHVLHRIDITAPWS